MKFGTRVMEALLLRIHSCFNMETP